MGIVSKATLSVTRLKFFVTIAVCIALVLGIIGCAIPLSKRINGRWQKYEQDGQPVASGGWFECSPDHSVTVSFSGTTNPEDIVMGTYRLNDDHIVMDMDVSRDGRAVKNLSLTGTISFTENGDLILEPEDGSVTSWKRIK